MMTIAPRRDVLDRLGRAMADPTRARILLSLLDHPRRPGVLVEDLGPTRSNVSSHLACSCGCGAVVATPEGRATRYEVVDGHLNRALLALVDVVLAVDDGAGCTGDSCDVPLGCRVGA